MEVRGAKEGGKVKCERTGLVHRVRNEGGKERKPKETSQGRWIRRKKAAGTVEHIWQDEEGYPGQLSLPQADPHT